MFFIFIGSYDYVLKGYVRIVMIVEVVIYIVVGLVGWFDWVVIFFVVVLW